MDVGLYKREIHENLLIQGCKVVSTETAKNNVKNKLNYEADETLVIVEEA